MQRSGELIVSIDENRVRAPGPCTWFVTPVFREIYFFAVEKLWSKTMSTLKSNKGHKSVIN